MPQYCGFSTIKYSIAEIDTFYAYRNANRLLAFRRDNGRCMKCWMNGAVRAADEIHHVYGHGTPRNLTNEHYTKMLCLCGRCHYEYHSISHDKRGMEAALELANRPSSRFRPERDIALLQEEGVVWVP